MRKYLKRASGIIAAVLVGIVLGTPLATERALHRRQRLNPAPEEATAVARETDSNWEAVRVHAVDGVQLSGWLFVPREPNASGVVVLHGVGDTRLGMLEQSAFLLRKGFTVLVPDSRGHGESGGDLITYGIREAGDVRCWTDWLMRSRGIQRLYGVGTSMGAAILLQSLPKEPRFRAVVAECPFSTFEAVSYYRLHHASGLPEATFLPVVKLGFLYTLVKYGVDLRQASPIEVIRAACVPTLLIHGTADVNIPFHHSELLHAANPRVTKLWLVPGADHFSLYETNPDLFARTVLEWFDSHS